LQNQKKHCTRIISSLIHRRPAVQSTASVLRHRSDELVEQRDARCRRVSLYGAHGSGNVDGALSALPRVVHGDGIPTRRRVTSSSPRMLGC